MITGVTVSGKTPGERARRDLDISLDQAADDEPGEWVSMTIRQPNGTSFATIRISVDDLQRALGTILGSDFERRARDLREAAILNRNAERLNAETAEVMEFQREP